MSSWEVRVPNSRFGTTFLDIKYRDHAAPDEVMLDKKTGEIIYRRKDGKYLFFDKESIHVYEHFSQIKKRIMSYEYWACPNASKAQYANSYFATFITSCLDYEYNASETEVEAGDPIGLLHGHSLVNTNLNTFSISQEANGFFINVQTAPRDRALMGILAGRYNAEYANYNGTDVIALQKAAMFKKFNYLESNLVLNYTVTWYDTNGEVRDTETADAYVTANENVLIPFKKKDIYSRSYVNSTKLKINSISAPKLVEGYDLIMENGSVSEKTMLNSVMDSPDITINSFMISHFFTSTDDLLVMADQSKDTSYIFSMGMDDYESVLSRVGSELANGCTLASIEPNKTTWETTRIWYELINRVHTIDDIEFVGRDTTMKTLEEMLMGSRHSASYITPKKDDLNGFYLSEEQKNSGN